MIHTFGTSLDTAQAIAKLLYERANAYKNNGKFFSIAISGGNTPKLLFEFLANNYLETFPWETLRIFWVDERCVAPSDEDSNYRMTFESLLSKIPIPVSSIFRMQGETNPLQEVERYQLVLEAQLPISNGIPVLDFILLGMGDDGHTASIFPNQMELLTNNQIVAIGNHPQSGQKRITLAGKTILNSKEIVFYITGTSKSSILREILTDQTSKNQYPADFIYQHGGNKVSFYLDALAASKLNN